MSANEPFNQTTASVQTETATTDPIDYTIWLTFSTTDYAKERAAVKQYFSKSYAVMEIEGGSNYIDPPIYIAEHDLNNDGNPELIVFLVGSVFHGASSSGSLDVLSYDGNKITGDYNVAVFPIDYEKLDRPGNDQVGIIRRDTGNYDLMILGSLWKYNMNWIKQAPSDINPATGTTMPR